MKVEQFSSLADLVNKSEVQKVEHLSFYLLENKDQSEFTVKDLAGILVALGFAQPNLTRLKTVVKKSSVFNKGIKADYFRLSAKAIKSLREQYPNLSESEEIMSDDSLLPEVLFNEARRQYLIRAAQQINAAYENNLFDACSLMMRRLLEILLIHCFEAKGIQDRVKDEEGNYQNLKTLINKAKTFTEIPLSNDAKKDIDSFRELGNLSAHRVRYNCRRDDIRVLRVEYRAVIEELLYVSGLTAQ